MSHFDFKLPPDNGNGKATPTTRPVVKRGRIVVMGTMDWRSVSWNPNSISRTHGWTWGERSIPSHTHPMYGGGSGTAETLSFTLRIDGERGRHDVRHVLSPAGRLPIPFDINDELQFYRALKLPDEEGGVPPRCVVTLGTAFRGVVLVTNVAEVMTHFTKDYEPVRAEVTLDMVVYRTLPLLREEMFGPGDDANEEWVHPIFAET